MDKYFSVYSIFLFTTFLTLTRSLVEFACWGSPPHSHHGELHANLSGGSGNLCGVLPSCGTSSPLFFLSGGSWQPSAPSTSARPLIVTTSWNLNGVIQIINYKKLSLYGNNIQNLFLKAWIQFRIYHVTYFSPTIHHHPQYLEL